MRDLARAAGRIAVADIAAGEIVTELRLAGARLRSDRLARPGRGCGPSQVPVASAVGVKPGDLVDVIATFGGGGAHTEVAGEAIEVLAVDRAGGGASFGGATAPTSGGVGLVLLVTPTDAETPRVRVGVRHALRSRCADPTTSCRATPSPFR